MATYYVNGSGSTYSGVQGSYGIGVDDAGVNGALATPWASMQYAESRLTAGDTVYVAAGTYNENESTQNCLYLQKAATWIADGIVEVRPYSSTAYAGIVGGTTAAISMSGFVFDGTRINGATDATHALYLNTGSNNKTFIDCTFKNALTNLIYAPGANDNIVLTRPIFSGSPATAAIYAANIGLTVTHITVNNYSGARIFYHTAATRQATFNGGSITAALNSRVFQDDGDGKLTITGITAAISTNSTEPGAFVYINTANKTGNIIVSNNDITYTLTPGNASTTEIICILNGSHNTTVTGNTIRCNSAGQTMSAIKIARQPVVICNYNKIYYESTGIVIPLYILSTGSVMSVTCDYNTVYTKQTASQAIVVGSDVPGTGDNKIDGASVSHNKVYAPLGGSCHNIEYGYNKNGTVVGNYTYGGRYGIVIKGAETYTTGYVAYNIIIDPTYEGIRVKGVKNLPVYNNTLYLSEGRTILNGLLYITVNPDSSNASSTGCIAKNNIMVAPGGNNVIKCDVESVSGLTLDYNCYYMSSGKAPIYALIGTTQYQGASAWTSWQAASYDAHGISGLDPKFRSTTDFHLRSSSPCINAGTTIEGLTTDFDGKKVPPNGSGFVPDIGAYDTYEYSQGSLIAKAVIPAGNTAAKISIISVDDAIESMLYIDNGYINAFDGVNTASLDISALAAGEHAFTVRWDYSLGTMAVGVVGLGSVTWGSDVTYRGFWETDLSEYIRCFYAGGNYPMYIKSIIMLSSRVLNDTELIYYTNN